MWSMIISFGGMQLVYPLNYPVMFLLSQRKGAGISCDATAGSCSATVLLLHSLQLLHFLAPPTCMVISIHPNILF